MRQAVHGRLAGLFFCAPKSAPSCPKSAPKSCSELLRKAARRQYKKPRNR